MRYFTLIPLAILLFALQAAAQTFSTGDLILQRKNASGPHTLVPVTPVNNGVWAFDGTGALVIASALPQSLVTDLTTDLAGKQPLDDDLTAVASRLTASYGLDLLTIANASGLRSYAGLVIGTDVQAYDGTLAALAGVTTSTNTGIYAVGSDSFSTYTLTAGGRALGGVTGTANSIPYFSGTNSVSSQTTTTGGLALLNNAGTANTVPYYSASNTVSLTSFTAAGRALAAISTGTSGTFPYFSGTNTVSLATVTATGLALLDDADATAMRSTLGLVVGTNVQAFDADLTDLADGTLTGTKVQQQMSITSDGSGLKLSGDSSSPGNRRVYGTDGSGTKGWQTTPVEIGVACSDETTDIASGTGKVTFRMPHAMTVTAVRASVTTAPTGSTIVVDINEGGSSILSTKLSIDASEKTSTTAASAAAISDTSLADDAEITIDFDQVGASVPGTGVKIWIIGTR